MTAKKNSTKNMLAAFFIANKSLVVWGAMLIIPYFALAAALESEDVLSVKAVAEKGDVEAMCEMGRRHRYGIGVERNDIEAAKWTTKAASAKARPSKPTPP